MVTKRETQRAIGDRVAERVKLGQHVHEVAASLRIPAHRVTYWIRRHGIQANPCDCHRGLVELKVVALRLRGVTRAEIARVHGVSRQYVHQICERAREAGIPNV